MLKYSKARQRVETNFREFQLLTAVVLLIMLFGTLGYALVEGWSLIDGFYMTVITLSTVGYKEVHDLSPAGQLFTAALIMAGVGIAIYSFTFVTQAIVEGDLNRFRGFKRMERAIKSLTNHTIVCGWGRLGYIVTRDLLEAGEEVVVVDKDINKSAELSEDNIMHVTGQSYDDDVLISAGIERAANLLALLPSDADNVYTILCARDLNPSINIVARTEDETGESRLLRAGATQVISPYRVSGTRIVHRLVRPNVSDFLELASGKHGEQLAIEEILIPSGCSLIGKSLEESRLRQTIGVTIAAFRTPDGDMVFSPGRESVIVEGSTLIALGEKAGLDKLTEMVRTASSRNS
ncbi:MAG: potassium channel protein [Bdellovibrionales bacterium]|nr:potassium channel protein [Bdellovibrionales bacterium]